MVDLTPNPSFSLSIRVSIPNRAGTLARVTQAIASCGGNLGQISLLEQTRKVSQREITVDASSSDHAEKIVEAVQAVPETKVLKISDRTFDLHRGGKIRIESRLPLKAQSDLAMAYTPGVGRICWIVAFVNSFCSIALNEYKHYFPLCNK